MLPSVAFFGLGALGAPLALHLHRAGYPLAVHDPREEALELHRRACGSNTADARSAAVWITCVTDEDAAEMLYLGADGLADRIPAGSVVIDHTTTSPAFARRVGQALARRDIGYVDCPLSGGVAGARDGKLLAMQGGHRADAERVATVLGTYCRRIEWFGDTGSGQAAKLANQLAIAGTVRGLHEAVRFAHTCGLDPRRLFDALASGSAHSAQMDQHAARLAESDAPFAAHFGWITKDLVLARAELLGAHADPGLAGWLLQELGIGAR